MAWLTYALIGLVSGVTGGLFGVGGGIIIVPALCYFLGIPIKTAIGTSLAVIIPTALVGAGKHYHQGNVDWKMALAIAPLAIVGAFAGAWLTQHLSIHVLRKGFALLMFYVGFRLFMK